MPATAPHDELARPATPSRPTIALALGAGGAKGLAHIGVIEEIEAQGFEIVAIAGTSMGALIGGIHAAGKLDVYRDWVCELAKRSDERRVGKECVSTCRSRWSPCH